MSAETSTPAICTPQGVDSNTWTCPPFYGDMTVPELYAFHAENSPDHAAFAFLGAEEQGGAIEELTYSTVFRAIRQTAGIVARHVRPASYEDSTVETAIGILAVTDSPSMLTLLVAIMYLGHTPFALSPRNSAAAVVHLIRTKSVHELLVSRDPAMQRIAREVQDELAKEGYDVIIVPLPDYREMYSDGGCVDVKLGPVSPKKVGLILHSSGSTAFPKPIPILHQTFTRWAYSMQFGDLDVCGLRLSVHGPPLFHIYGILSFVFSLGSGLVPTYFRPTAPPIVPTAENVLSAIVRARCEAVFGVPAFIEAWSRLPDALPVLQSLAFITTTGGPLEQQVGDSLRKKGVKIITRYGSTEMGPITRNFPNAETVELHSWEYFSLSSQVTYTRHYHEGYPGVFELVIVESPVWSPSVFNTTEEGKRAYATSDLLQEHPQNRDWFRVYGRIDDQIMLSTGEKTNPGPMESIMKQDPNVKAALIFGRGRLQNGILIQPIEPFDPADEDKLTAFRSLIWLSIEKANTLAPSHSRIFKEMVITTKPDKPLQQTAKGSLRRPACLKDYEQEINELYKKVEESSQVGVLAPPDWSDVAVGVYVRNVVERVLKVPGIEDRDDLFQQGCDSLQATWIRNTIIHALRTTTKISVHKLSINFVYANPSIAALSSFLRNVLSGASVDEASVRTARLSRMKELLEKYGTNFPTPRWSRDRPLVPESAPRTVLLTGSTGRLGSHLLSQLVRDPSIARVYALNRATSSYPSDVDLAERQEESFKIWGLDRDSGLLSRKVTFYVVDLAKPCFGLEEDIYKELQGSVTTIIHNAWRVDFNVTLSSFEPLLSGMRNVLDLSLESSVPGGPKVLFVSSIGAVQNYALAEPAPETLEFGPEVALGLGYGESKWIAEQLCRRAAADVGVKATVVRVGQLCGDTRLGRWNVKEWIPAVIHTGQRLGSVPAKDDTVSWVPVDSAAAVLLEMACCDELVLHLVSPRTVTWNDIFQPIADNLRLPLVPASDFTKMFQSGDASNGHDTLKAEGHDSADTLIGHFKTALLGRATLFSTVKAVNVSRTLASLQPVGEADAMRWLAYWKSVRFLTE